MESVESVASMIAKSRKSTRITVSLADEEYAELAALAEKYDVSLSWLTRQAVMELLKRQKLEASHPSLDLPVTKRGEGQ